MITAMVPGRAFRRGAAVAALTEVAVAGVGVETVVSVGVVVEAAVSSFGVRDFKSYPHSEQNLAPSVRG